MNGLVTFDQLNPEGVLGDKILCNGKIEPVLKVARRKYRFPLLNGGPTRFFEMVLQNKSANVIYPFTYIANDGNLLPAPLQNQTSVRFAPAERGRSSRFTARTFLRRCRRVTSTWDQA